MRDRKRLMVRGLLLLDPGPNRKPNTDGLLFCKEEMRCFIAERFTAAPSRGGISWWELSHHFPESSTERSSRRRSALIPRASPEREPAAEQVRVFGHLSGVCARDRDLLRSKNIALPRDHQRETHDGYHGYASMTHRLRVRTN